ncbi:MAG: hypothetical protein HY593_04105 [Candidatus Omnitrophica bacterium]|nr:hypothetical protein [Candidatus Omnitrophota bacterium]
MGRIIRDFKAWVGHGVDLVRILKFNFRNPHSYTKFRMICSFKEKAGCHVLIEAGTYHGVMADRCSAIFDKVYTIELDEGLARRASCYLRDKRNVSVICGDALKILSGILEKDEVRDVLVYLDGHFSGEGTACGELAEPAVEELNVLSKHKSKVHAIVVDDFRSFGTEAGFPSKSSLLKSAEDAFGGGSFEITVHLDQPLIVKKEV